MNVRDHLVGEQITIGVDWPIVIVIAVKRIITVSWVPIARVQEIISAGDENDVVTMLPPPIAIMPFVLITTERIRIAEPITSSLVIFPDLVRFRITIRRITDDRLHIAISCAAWGVDCLQAFRNLSLHQYVVGGL